MKLLLKLSLITTSMLIFTFTGWCNDDSVIYLALQNGNQDTGSPAPLVGRKDTYLSALEEIHGDLKENRDVSPIILSFDFYKTNGSFASGFGLKYIAITNRIVLKMTVLRSGCLQLGCCTV